MSKLSRREFIKLSALVAGALVMPCPTFEMPDEARYRVFLDGQELNLYEWSLEVSAPYKLVESFGQYAMIEEIRRDIIFVAGPIKRNIKDDEFHIIGGRGMDLYLTSI